MSWQDRERERYEERLREKWTADGQFIVCQTPYGAVTQSVPITAVLMPSKTYLQHVDKYHAELYTSTREICGND